MKTIALSMIFSLAVIVCEQQTLFAPPTSTCPPCINEFSPSAVELKAVPIAGVNRLVPLAGSGDGVISAATEFLKHDSGLVDTAAGLSGNSLQPIPDPSMHLPAATPVEPPSLSRIDSSCPECDLEFRFGVAGSAFPSGDDI